MWQEVDVEVLADTVESISRRRLQQEVSSSGHVVSFEFTLAYIGHLSRQCSRPFTPSWTTRYATKCIVRVARQLQIKGPLNIIVCLPPNQCAISYGSCTHALTGASE